MADGQTTNYEFVLPEIGFSANTWGAKHNQNWTDLDADLQALQDAIDAGAATIATHESRLDVLEAAPSLVKDHGSVSGTVAIDYEEGTHHKMTLAATSTFTFVNLPQWGRFSIAFVAGQASVTVTNWPAGIKNTPPDVWHNYPSQYLYEFVVRDGKVVRTLGPVVIG